VNEATAVVGLHAVVAELVAWRHEAESTIARLEAEVAQLRLARDPTGPVLPEFKELEKLQSGWTAPAPSAPSAPEAGAAAAPRSAPVAVSPAASPPATAAPVIGWAPPAAVPVAKPAPRAFRQYDLEMKPGESIDIPGSMNAGRKKRLLGWLVLVVFAGGLIALVVAALASQR
jgi:hypothetical protein